MFYFDEEDDYDLLDALGGSPKDQNGDSWREKPKILQHRIRRRNPKRRFLFFLFCIDVGFLQ